MQPIEVHVIMNNSARQICYFPVVFNLPQKQAERTLKILNHSGLIYYLLISYIAIFY